ncbi:allophanate hydrolase [Methylocystaceae bacterium]|nr:allophanate hydrolase [Methylocystaceae bacterium]
MNAELLIHAAGPCVTLQDKGRYGYRRYGVTPAGPMDYQAFAAATRAVNASVAIEISLGGATLSCIGAPLAAAIVGGHFDCRLDGKKLPSACRFPLTPESLLTIRAGESGAWCYFAVDAHLESTKILGSYASHTRSGIGLRSFTAGDRLLITPLLTPPIEYERIEAQWLSENKTPIRIMLGPQQDYFSPQSLQQFLTMQWRVGAHSDRMAYTLEGEPLTHLRGHDLISDGATMGAIQIPGSGLPFVLMADCQPTGGYPKIATIIGADLGRFAQYRPGDSLRFELVTLEQAINARYLLREALSAGASFTRQDTKFSDLGLLSHNLIGGVISASDEPDQPK